MLQKTLLDPNKMLHNLILIKITNNNNINNNNINNNISLHNNKFMEVILIETQLILRLHNLIIKIIIITMCHLKIIFRMFLSNIIKEETLIIQPKILILSIIKDYNLILIQSIFPHTILKKLIKKLLKDSILIHLLKLSQ